MGKRVLFVGHEASRTGAPVAFLSELRWMKMHTDLESRVLLLRGGPLVSEYKKILPTSVLGHTSIHVSNRFRDRVYAAAQQLPFRAQLIHARNVVRRSQQSAMLRRQASLVQADDIDLLYCNSIASLTVLSQNIPAHVPLIVHVHEMAIGIKYGLGSMQLSDLANRPVRYIAAGPMVATTLTQTFGIDPAIVSVVHPGIENIDAAAYQSQAADIRQSLGIANDAIIVGMVGTVDWRKGADLFVQMARIVARQSSKDVHFLWVGGSAEYETFRNEWHAHLDVSPDLIARVHFVGEKSDARPYIAAMDIFALTSREDPFPLVALEAGLLGKPVVCFEKSGGTAEWVRDGAGCVALHLDVDDFARHIVRLMDDRSLCESCGECARRIVRERYLIDVTAPKIFQIMQNAMR